MKRLFINLLLVSICINCLSQEVSTISCETYANEVFKGVTVEMPGYREINSGSKFIVNYDGDWPLSMVGAFDYAVKLWEEVLPPTLPINITAKIAKIRGSKKVLSRVQLHSLHFADTQHRYPVSMVKSVLLQEYHRGTPIRFCNEIPNVAVLEDEDIQITYNESILDEFSFSLDGDPSCNKYDFVTVALRDIALGLGFVVDITANTNLNRLDSLPDRLSPYETLITDKIGKEDLNQAYINATQGLLSISLKDEWGSIFDTISVYAPTQWNNGQSLRYLYPEDGKPLTQLLTYDFGKGYVIRDLSGVDWNKIFCGALDWRREIPTGGRSNGVSQTGTSDDVLPYQGSVSFSFNERDNKVFEIEEQQGTNVQQFTDGHFVFRDSNILDGIAPYTTSYCDPYNLLAANRQSNSGISLSALLEDGTWDCLYLAGGFFDPLVLNIESLPLHYDEKQYARGTSGNLRYRLTNATQGFSSIGGAYIKYKTKYFTRDFTPQAAKIKYYKVCTADDNMRTMKMSDDDYFVDVMIGISNLEGTTRVIVEQWEEGEPLPFQYEVEDFRSGYFIANLDRELSTQLTVVSYNANGARRSNTITVPAVGYPNKTISLKKVDETIELDGISPRLMSSGQLTCSICSPVNSGGSMMIAPLEDGRVDISSLSNGIYVLVLYNGNDKIGDFKFVK